jgi:hypothetical protein
LNGTKHREKDPLQLNSTGEEPFPKHRYRKGKAFRASPARVVNLATQKVQLTTLATAFSLHTPTDLLFYSLLPLKYYFSFFFYYIFLSTLNQRENKHIYNHS